MQIGGWCGGFRIGPARPRALIRYFPLPTLPRDAHLDRISSMHGLILPFEGAMPAIAGEHLFEAEEKAGNLIIAAMKERRSEETWLT